MERQHSDRLTVLQRGNGMYIHCDRNDSGISLHDCIAEEIRFENGVLSFSFPDGFWITPAHPENETSDAIRTDSSRVDYRIADADADSIGIYVFRQSRFGKTIREDWLPADFIKAVNRGDYRVEFITRYKGYQSVLYKCWLWFDRKPYHRECEITLQTDGASFNWNRLRPDRTQ